MAIVPPQCSDEHVVRGGWMADKYCWTKDSYREVWRSGTFDSVEVALADARVEDPDQTKIWVGEASQYKHATFFSAARVIEDARQRASDEVEGQDYPDVSEEAEKELDALLLAWAEKHIPGGPTFYQVDDIVEYRWDGSEWHRAPKFPKSA